MSGLGKTLSGVVLLGAVAVVAAAPAHTQGVKHAESAIIIPDKIGDLILQPSKDGAFAEHAKAYSYANTDDRVELNIFRATYPQVGIWYQQAQALVRQRLGDFNLVPAGDRKTILDKANKPVGLRQTFNISAPFASSSFAVLGFDNWLVFIHSTSRTLTSAGQDLRLDVILAGVSAGQAPKVYYGVDVPVDCPTGSTSASASTFSKDLVANATLEMKLVAGLAATIASVDAVGGDGDGLATSPGRYCLARSASGRTSWYVPKEGGVLKRCILPVSVTGLTLEGMLVPRADAKRPDAMIGVVVANGYTSSKAVSLFEGWPDPIFGQMTALPSFVSANTPLASVDHGTTDVIIAE